MVPMSGLVTSFAGMWKTSLLGEVAYAASAVSIYAWLRRIGCATSRADAWPASQRGQLEVVPDLS